MNKNVLPSQEVCAQLDIKAEELEEALIAIEEITGCKHPKRPCFSPQGYIESAVAIEHEGSSFDAVDELHHRLNELREHCGLASSFVRSIEATYALVGRATSMNVKAAPFDAARDAVAEAIRAAIRAADEFEIDWGRRKTLARLR